MVHFFDTYIFSHFLKIFNSVQKLWHWNVTHYPFRRNIYERLMGKINVNENLCGHPSVWWFIKFSRLMENSMLLLAFEAATCTPPFKPNEGRPLLDCMTTLDWSSALWFKWDMITIALFVLLHYCEFLLLHYRGCSWPVLGGHTSTVSDTGTYKVKCGILFAVNVKGAFGIWIFYFFFVNILWFDVRDN